MRSEIRCWWELALEGSRGGSFALLQLLLDCWQSVVFLGLQLSPSNSTASAFTQLLCMSVFLGSKFPLLLRMSVIWSLRSHLNHYDLISTWSCFPNGPIHRLQGGIVFSGRVSTAGGMLGLDVTRWSNVGPALVPSPSASLGGPLCPTSPSLVSHPPFLSSFRDFLVQMSYSKERGGGHPGGPGVKTLLCQCRGHMFKPGRGN